MLEDEIYRTSSQYRLWSFTEDALTTTRRNTNAIASKRVRTAIRRAQDTRQSTTTTPSSIGTPNPNESSDKAADSKNGEQQEKEIECLTPEEELELVRYYCEKTMELGNEYEPPLPTTVRVSLLLTPGQRANTNSRILWCRQQPFSISVAFI